MVPTGGSSPQMPGHSSISNDPPDVATASTTQADGSPDNSQTHFLTGEQLPPDGGQGSVIIMPKGVAGSVSASAETPNLALNPSQPLLMLLTYP